MEPENVGYLWKASPMSPTTVGIYILIYNIAYTFNTNLQAVYYNLQEPKLTKLIWITLSSGHHQLK